MKRISSLCVALFLMLSMQAQEARMSWNFGAVSEGQWNTTTGETGWANLVNVGFGVKLWRGAVFDASVLSTYSVGTPIADDFQGFSNIDAENRGLRLFHAGLSQEFFDGAFTAFIGLKAADEDYFNTELAGLFTGSSYGCMPTCTENQAIAVYPEAALAVHLEFNKGGWTLRETLYNGAPSDRLDEQFRFRPGRDGLFNIGSVMYSLGEDTGAFYTLGYAVTTKQAHGQSEFGLWCSVEQPVCHIGGSRLSLLAQGSKHFTGDAVCKGFWAGGFVVDDFIKDGAALGLAVNRAYYLEGNETDVELTFKCPLGYGFAVQPAVHFIRTAGVSTTVAQLRLCYEIGN